MANFARCDFCGHELSLTKRHPLVFMPKAAPEDEGGWTLFRSGFEGYERLDCCANCVRDLMRLREFFLHAFALARERG